MSLIEKALEKMRAEGGAGESANDGVSISRRAATAATSQREVIGSSASSRRARLKTVSLNQDALTEAGVIASESRQHQQISDYRHIKRHVIEAASLQSASTASRLIMVTSALPGEGKTFTSVNLALSLALERDSSVLLIDGDVAKPNASRLLGIEANPGLLDALAEQEADSEEMVLGTNVPGLELMSAGRATATATEYLSSARMGAVMQQLAAIPNRYIVIDSPPLLVTTEAAAMAKSAGQVIVVVRADFTLRRATQDALQLLGERDGVSLVLNRARQTRLEQYYYGYQYGAQYGEQPFPKALPISSD